MFKLLAFIFLASIALALAQKSSDNCDVILKDADRCLTKIIYVGDWNITLIRNEAELNDHCRLTKKTFNCVKRYQRCLNSFPREVFNVLTRNARKLNKERCEDPTGRKEFLTHIKCFDNNTRGVNVCMDKTISLLNYIASNVSGDRETMLSAACCSVQLSLDCFAQEIKKTCNKKTGANTDEYMKEKINSVVSDVFDLACTKHSNIQQCDESSPKIMKAFRNHITPDSKVKKAKTSPLIPLIRVVKKIKLE